MTYCVKNYLLSIGYFYKRHSIQLGHTLTGFAVGSVWRVAYGGAANFLCLSKDGPEYNKINTAATEYRNVIKGVEFQTYDYGIFPNTAYNQNVACARCYSERSAVMMLPARRTCPAGWYKEYEGD